MTLPIHTAGPYYSKSPHRILSLDGGGSKGAFTLGVLKRIEQQVGCPLRDYFTAIYGTSTGAIISAYLSLGFTVDEIYKKYLDIIPHVMSRWTATGRSIALKKVADTEFGKCTFADAKCQLAIVATRCDTHQPLIFKNDVSLAHSQHQSFVPGFALPLSTCLMASAAAAPFFLRSHIELKTKSGSCKTHVIDGGFVANNPSLFALIDATTALEISQQNIYLTSIGTGKFPMKQRSIKRITERIWLLSDMISLLEETLESTANSADFMRQRLFPNVSTIRINPDFSGADFETDLLESDPAILRKMYAYGLGSY